MSKPISYYLSGKPPFPLESIERCDPEHQIQFATGLLNIALEKLYPESLERDMIDHLAQASNTTADVIDEIPPTEKIQLAAAILMVGCDQMIENGQILTNYK